MFRNIRWLATGVAIGVVADKVWLELQKPAGQQFPWLRERMNTNVNPWLMEHGIPGSAKAEIATLEHVGRKSGTTFYTPVHPTLRDDMVFIPAPLGVGSNWARNVLEAGRARLQFKETLYDLEEPELITVAEAGMVPPHVAAPFDHMGWRYLRLHPVASIPGTFATHKLEVPSEQAGPAPKPPIGETFEIPVEPRMVEPKAAPWDVIEPVTSVPESGA
jgi:hypothetical protein